MASERVGLRPRPEPGKITTKERRIPVCVHCRCVISDTGLCDESCGWDTEHAPEDIFHAVYKVTEEFLRDEPAQQ